jgi:hypothetical protein
MKNVNKGIDDLRKLFLNKHESTTRGKKHCADCAKFEQHNI